MKMVRAGDVDLHVVERGEGTPILLVHGFPLDHSMWSAQIEWLSSSWHVIAPDLRGFGNSQVTPGTVTMEQFADDLNALLEALEVREPVVFCGLSMGGYIGWQFWRKYAPRLRSLVLCDTRSAADSPEAVANRLKMIEHVHRAGTQYVAEAMLPKLFAAATFERMPGAVDFVRQRILAASAEGVAAALRGMAARPDATPWLSEVNLPTLAIVGEHDAITPVEEMQQMAAAIPGGELAVIPDAGHMTPLENPDAFNGILAQFLLRHQRTPTESAS